MNDYIKQCVNSRVDFFNKYYTVPAELKPEVEAFINEINKLGDAATDAVDFENKFASSELSERFNSLLTRCIPKAYNMTNEEKQHSKETAMATIYADRYGLIPFAGSDNHSGAKQKKMAGICCAEPIQSVGDFIEKVKNRETEIFTFLNESFA